MRAALIYQHRTSERDRAIADALDAMIGAVEDTSDSRCLRVMGTSRARTFVPGTERRTVTTKNSVLSRTLAVERVTGIEPAWPAWKVALGLRGGLCSGGEPCSTATMNDPASPCLMATQWPSCTVAPTPQLKRPADASG